MKIIFVVIFGALIGIKASDNLKKRCEHCALIIEMINRIGILIKYRSLSVYEISSELKMSRTFEKLDFIKNLPEEFSGESFSSLWIRAVEEDCSLGDEEKELLISFSEVFGVSDIEGQLSSVLMLKENLKSIQEKRCFEYEKKGKLYRSLGIIAGVMTGIIIL